jgi:hypothetical protein
MINDPKLNSTNGHIKKTYPCFTWMEGENNPTEYGGFIIPARISFSNRAGIIGKLAKIVRERWVIPVGSPRHPFYKMDGPSENKKGMPVCISTHL